MYALSFERDLFHPFIRQKNAKNGFYTEGSLFDERCWMYDVRTVFEKIKMATMLHARCHFLGLNVGEV